MRYAIISDVHANLPALRAVLDDIDASRADVILCAGDLVGYNPYPDEVVRALRDRGAICIAGNHDRALLQLDTSGMNPLAASAIYWTAKHVSEGSMEFLRRLRPRATLNLAGVPAAMFHGSVRADDEYVFEEDATAHLLELAKAQLVVSGHTHVPYVKRLPEGSLVNPGSVGQPRDGDWRASYLVYDGREAEFDLRRLEYPVEEVVKAVSAAGLPAYLGSRLLSGI